MSPTPAPGADGEPRPEHHAAEAEGAKDALDSLHLRKIDLADRVFVLNVDGYIGESTRGEIAYALSQGKPIEFLNPDDGEHFLESEGLGQDVAQAAMSKR